MNANRAERAQELASTFTIIVHYAGGPTSDQVTLKRQAFEELDARLTEVCDIVKRYESALNAIATPGTGRIGELEQAEYLRRLAESAIE